MSTPNAMQNLSPEMQARLAHIMAGQQPQAAADPAAVVPPQPQAPAPIQKPPSLMDHLLALRQEVAAMRQEMAQNTQTIAANSNVVDAVGQAVGEIYQMFQSTTNQAPTYSQAFTQQQQGQVDDGTDY